MIPATRDHVYAGFDPKTEIRVFRIGVDEDGAIVYTLQKVNFKEFSKSYCWGAERATVKVNGYDIKVSRNLVDFTRMLWDQFASQVEDWGCLWADAVCIDQDNKEEKAVQIKLMRYIYEEADCVLAWLGPEIATTHLARDLVDRILTLHDARTEDLGPSEAYQNIDVRCKELLSYKDGDSLLEYSIPADALYEFLSHNWWSRAWIMQEGSSNDTTHLFWGEQILEPRDMYTIGCYAREIFEELNYQWHDKNGYPDRYEVIAMRRTIHRIMTVYIFAQTRNAAMQHKLPTDALLVVEQVRKSEASDARDKIYAPLCLLNSESFDAFVVDYDLPIEEVYTDFAHRSIFSTDPPNLDILGLCIPDEDNESNLVLPSWVPDHTLWSTQSQFHKTLGPGNGPTYFADRCIRELITFDQSGLRISNGVLHVQGVFVDEVVAMSPRSDIRYAFEMTHDWLPKDHKDSTYLTNEPMDVVYRRTLVADLAENEDETMSGMRRGYQLDWIAIDGHDVNRYLSMVVRHAETWTGRRLLLSRNGYLGVGPNSLQIGDQLHILLGGQVVYALRRKGGFEQYHLVGECYVHGLMDGGFGPIQLHQVQEIQLG